MKINRKALMKHQFHKAGDMKIEIRADLMTRKIELLADWIDTALIESVITLHAIQMLNEELEKVNKLPLLVSLEGFNVELIVSNGARFSVHYVRSEVDARQNTMVLRLLKD